ncbi:MAG TPA: tRNA epoxyqueuosine(34) reductase QueG [Candidatus Didemnitutus sp.]|nr:tRNA epoxyqueuosine(34) reductase QueG [Candidatus Didemnitutus sp.]
MTTSDRTVWAGERREELRQRLLGLGFDEVRFATAADEGGGGLRQWLADGMQADMAWIDRSVEKRLDAQQVLPGARTVILLGVNYWPGKLVDQDLTTSERPRWARYVLHDDYHDTMKPGLVAAGRVLEELGGVGSGDYRYYVDTGPVLERGWAARSGLGFRGKNGMLISRRHGNWLFLAAILTRLEIAPDQPLRKKPLPADGAEPAGLLCGKCTRCMDACPTQAIPQSGVVDARRCISYQTIENKGIIPRELRAGIGPRIYGCDVCLEVCPWNRFAQEGRRMLLAARYELGELSLRELLELTPALFAEVFRKTAVKRLKLTGLLRNACVVAGNTAAGAGEACELLPALLRLATHESAMVRAHAVWAVRKIAGHVAAENLLREAQRGERDESVLAEYAAPI